MFQKSKLLDDSDIVFEAADDEINMSVDSSIVFERFNTYDDSITSSVGGIVSGNAPLMQQPANNLMLLSLLEHMCTLYMRGDEEASDQLFTLLCEKLSCLKLIPNFGSLDDLKAIRQKYQSALMGLMMGAIENIQFSSNNLLDVSKASEIVAKSSSSLTLHSWYKDMFCQETQIAFGGFGEVVKARNKLDQKEYAIKKVKLMESEPDVCFKTLREVQVISDLHHANIVRYHSAWLEYGIEEFSRHKTKARDNNDGSFDIDIKENSLGNFNMDLLQNRVKSNGRKYQRYISYMDTDDEMDKKTCDVKPKLEKVGRQRTFSRSLSSGDLPFDRENLEEVNYCRGKMHYVNGHKKQALNMTLFIQMELCHLTLRDWIKTRNSKINSISEVEILTNLKIFQQILSALHYIHCQGLIHRDIKPANIFLNCLEGNNILVKIGDFGLARHHTNVVDFGSVRTDSTEKISGDLDVSRPFSTSLSFLSINYNELDYTVGVGTAIYAAPEQQSQSNYSSKVDIFSLGIILFEMFFVFKTEMERIKSIEKLLYSSTCENIAWNGGRDLILRMTSKDPEIRPSADFIIDSTKTSVLVENVEELYKKIQTKDMEIERLNELVGKLQSQICDQCYLSCPHRK